MTKTDQSIRKAKEIIDKLSAGNMVKTDYLLECLKELVDNLETQKNTIKILLKEPPAGPSEEYGWRG